MRRRTFIAIAAIALASAGSATLARQAGDVRGLVADLGAADPGARAKAACGLREQGDRAAGAIPDLVKLLADAAPVEGPICGRQWRHADLHQTTTPGEEAAAALAAIGSTAFVPVVGALRGMLWVARRNAAWTLGVLDDRRAVTPLIETLRDTEAPVRERAAWALGAIGDSEAVPALVVALKDADPRVRREAAWALGVIGK
jgi:HEAT repeat protein